MCKEIGCRVSAYVMGDVATLPASNDLRVQIWIRTSFYSLRRVAESYSSRSAVTCEPSSLDNVETVVKTAHFSGCPKSY